MMGIKTIYLFTEYHRNVFLLKIMLRLDKILSGFCLCSENCISICPVTVLLNENDFVSVLLLELSNDHLDLMKVLEAGHIVEGE